MNKKQRESKQLYVVGYKGVGNSYVIFQQSWEHAEAKEHKAPDIIIVPDLRFPKEEEWILSNKGTLIRVIRSSQQKSTDPHPSESQIDSLSHHYVIENSFDSLTKLNSYVKSQYKLHQFDSEFNYFCDCGECGTDWKSQACSARFPSPRQTPSGNRKFRKWQQSQAKG